MTREHTPPCPSHEIPAPTTNTILRLPAMTSRSDSFQTCAL